MAAPPTIATDPSPTRRRALQLGAAAAGVVMLCAWLALPLWRASIYLALDHPLRAWEAALRAPASAKRDDLLRRVMLASVPTAAGGTTTAWRGFLATGLDSVRDEREPSWVRYGPEGQRVEAYLAELDSWPWLACGVPPETAELALLGWRWVELHASEPDRSAAERAAHEAARQGVLRRTGQDERSLALASAVGHLAGAAAYEIWSGTDETSLRPLVWALRLGHLPRVGADGSPACECCAGPGQPAPGVTLNADGSLGWRTATGDPVRLPAPIWLEGTGR